MELQPYATIDPTLLGMRIQEARKARRLTQQEVAEAIGVARTTVVAMEKGERRIQPEEIIRLAALFGRDVHDLIRQRPAQNGFTTLFRTLAARDEHETAEREAHAIEFQRLCEDYLELEQLCDSPMVRRYPPEYSARGTPIDRAAEDIATQERNRLGLGDGPVLHLRELLENDVGLRVFYMDLPSRIAGMFCYTEQLGGCIAVNARHPDERCRWSLAHEFGHFLTSRYRPDVVIIYTPGRLSMQERLADGIARYFLMPSSGLSRRFNMLRRANAEVITPADLLTLADYFQVSFEALLRRLEDLHLLPIGTWERLQDAGFKVREAQSPLALPGREGASDRELLPVRYQYLAVEAFERAELTEGQLARYLRTDRLEARRIAHQLGERPDISPTGEAGVLPIDFAQEIIAPTA
jgi:Zn-dependent peptidase ImmA (M78 family)/DNA-binding XRE family transcriptional regulator